jgi:hypothetical protein
MALQPKNMMLHEFVAQSSYACWTTMTVNIYYWLLRCFNTFLIQWVLTVTLVADGHPNQEDICGWAVGTDNARGREELLRAVRAGEYPNTCPVFV